MATELTRISKELYIEDKDKLELELIVAELNAKSVRVFLADFFRAWTDRIKRGEPAPLIFPKKDFERRGKVNVNYAYDADVAYEARRLASYYRTNLASYLRAMIEWLCEEHRQKRDVVWILGEFRKKK
ncbi:MAG TPA: hypothetical protein DCL77_14590 [Prolixibacteraceae bacterium]|jgi:hypothetical protein|nr:hypothetical protein [Prolixibacteraceae bacterium]